jgi:hypothetical protein
LVVRCGSHQLRDQIVDPLFVLGGDYELFLLESVDDAEGVEVLDQPTAVAIRPAAEAVTDLVFLIPGLQLR